MASAQGLNTLGGCLFAKSVFFIHSLFRYRLWVLPFGLRLHFRKFILALLYLKLNEKSVVVGWILTVNKLVNEL